jgi:predicted porin
MQKKIIALAIAGLSGAAFAQSNVTISGTIGASYDSYSLSGATTARTTYNQNMVSDQSTAVILKGEEALGGGMKAWFQIDSRLTMDRGNGGVNNYSTGIQTSGVGNGNTAIGVSGNFGTVGVGRWDLHYDALAGIENLAIAPALAARFGHFGVMANVNGTQIAVGSRSANVMFYESPSFSGFKGRLSYSTNAYGGEGEAALGAANGNPGNGSSTNLKLNYDNGPLNVVYSYWNHKVEDRNNYTAGWAIAATGISNTPTATAAPNAADQLSNRLGVAYTFPMGVKVGLAWDRSTVKSNAATGDMTRTAWMLPVSYTTGAHMFAFNYAKAGKTSGAAAGADDNAASQYLLGYAYALSKRTTVGVQYMAMTNKTNGAYSLAGASSANTGLTAATAGEDGKLTTFNIRHNF